MTDPIVDFSDRPTHDAPRRRGRPRSPDTIDRDRRVVNVLTSRGAQTKDQLVAEIGLKPSLVYLALWRLKREGRVERTSGGGERYVWRLTA